MIRIFIRRKLEGLAFSEEVSRERELCAEISAPASFGRAGSPSPERAYACLASSPGRTPSVAGGRPPPAWGKDFWVIYVSSFCRGIFMF